MDYMSTPSIPLAEVTHEERRPRSYIASVRCVESFTAVCARDQPWRWSPAARARHASLAVAIDHPEIVSNERDTPEVHHVG